MRLRLEISRLMVLVQAKLWVRVGTPAALALPDWQFSGSVVGNFGRGLSLALLALGF